MVDDKVVARRETVTIPTWIVGPADPAPPVRRAWGYWRIHPYPMLDDITDEQEDRQYSALILENRYYRVTVLPEIGGHLYAYDKASGRDIFYRPDTIKPGLVALCGAWIAGGIEFNFPCSHNPLTFRPVDHLITENPDGSATITIGAIEQVSRMRWSVGITLRPGVARIDTDIRLENRTAFPHRYYFWSNSAERVTEGTRFITPARSVYGWEGIMRYPVHNGKYLPPYRDHRSACDLFSRNLGADFFGCYDDMNDEGVVHVADHRVATGRKYFTWGNSDDGLVWQHILSDGAGPYIEIQAGPFETQGIFKLLEPHQVVRWGESWYGIRGTGGFEFANGDVAINLVRDSSGAHLFVHATRRIDAVRVRATLSDRQVGSWQGDLSPDAPADVSLAGLGADDRVRVLIESADGSVIAAALVPWWAEEDDLEDREALSADEKETVHGLAAQGTHWETQFDWPKARALHEKALSQDPLAIMPLTRMAILDLKMGLTNDGLGRLDRAARVVPDSAEVNYYRGVALRLAGRRKDAQEAFWKARLSPHFGALGRYMLGEMALDDGEYGRALEHFRAAEGFEPLGGKAWWGHLVALRLLHRVNEADALDGQISEADPINPVIACERAFRAEAAGSERRDAWKRARELLRDEVQTWIEVATDYAALGRFEDALRILEEAQTSSDSPLVEYHAAHYLERAGRSREAHEARLKAAGAAGAYVSPHRIECEEVFREAMGKNPSDRNAPFYLGTFLAMVGRTDEARKLWEKAADAGCAEASLYSCLGWLRWQTDSDRESALGLFAKAAQLRPDDFRIHADIDALHEQLGRSAEERLAHLSTLPPAVRRKGSIPQRMVRLLTQLGRYDEARAILNSHRFNPWEGEVAMRRVYTDAWVGSGESLLEAGEFRGAREAFEEALKYPVHLGVGRPHRASDAAIYYRAGLACEAAGDPDAAAAHWRSGAAEEHHPIPSLERYYVECCRWKLGAETEAAANLGAIRHALLAREQTTNTRADDRALLGLVETSLGNPDRARAAFDEALRLSPGHAVAKRGLRALDAAT